ncbi:Signal transducer regulating beta-lactamase production, contains metallopeptidase domain [Nannocystis exedens]|uniref:Signal transducer regulating beta-lactamase production, contains metallopeptidase domain n=1 Tax=Nannocystis exedens TaxID=54 RepID=A0A1I2DPC0_9BACT|nr:M56 family metallopeptidase [Nannocystis exedens]PCC69003.1 BlaR1 peptidase M56 [Nannocystis exedens]SFE82444.1 Signal transducer regulating beta-lactamase production, contains metallopeptidase domain [Nannocystis exedens]
MLDPAASLAGPAVHTMVSWLGTYFVHSSVLIGGVWAFTRFLPLDSLTRSLLWKMSLVGGLFTATLQTGLGVEPLLGSVHVEAGSLAPAEVAPAPATAIAPPPPQVVEFAAPVMRPQLHGCAGCEPQVMMLSDEGVTAVFAAPAHVRIEHAALVEPVAMIEPAVFAAPAIVPAMAPPGPPAPPIAAPAPPVESQAGVAAWVFAALFGLGATASLGRLGVTAIRLRRGLRGRTPLRQGPLRERLQRLMAHVRVPQDSVRLTMSERVGSPMALANREIVVPARAHGLAPRQQEAMLAHELAHVLRRDPAWQVLASVLEAALFFQPLNRVARRGMQEAAEELCDDWAVRHTGSGLHLARCLTEVAQWPGRSDLAGKFASPMAGKSSLLVRRVERLLDARERERGRWARRWRGLLGAALLATVGLGAPGLSLSVARAEVPEPPVPADPPELMPEPVFAAMPAAPTTVLGVAPTPPAPPTTVLGAPPTPPMAAMPGVAPTPPAPSEAVDGSPTAKQRRAVRKAERHERKAAELREQGQPGSSVQVFVPTPNYVLRAPGLRVGPPPPPPPPHAVGPVPPVPPTPPAPPAPPAYRFTVDDDDEHDDDSCADDHGASRRHVVVVPRVPEKLLREGGKAAVQAKVIDARQLRDLERAAAAIAKQASKLDAAKIEELKRRAEALARRAPELSSQQLAELTGRAEKIAAEVERKVEHLDLSGLADALEHLDVDGIADEVEREVERSLRASAREHGRAQAEAERELRRAERERQRALEDARRVQREAQREALSEQRRVDRERLQVEAEGRRVQAEARRAAEEAKRVQRARIRAGEAVRREVDLALRDGVIDAEEQRRIEEAARKAGG